MGQDTKVFVLIVGNTFVKRRSITGSSAAESPPQHTSVQKPMRTKETTGFPGHVLESVGLYFQGWILLCPESFNAANLVACCQVNNDRVRKIKQIPVVWLWAFRCFLLFQIGKFLLQVFNTEIDKWEYWMLCDARGYGVVCYCQIFIVYTVPVDWVLMATVHA